MSALASLAPAAGQMVGVPARAQQLIHTRQPAAAKANGVVKPQESAERPGKGGYHLKNSVRRLRHDIYLGLTGDERKDAERIYHWVKRGASRPSQRIVKWKGVKMDAEQAHALMVQEDPSLCEEHRFLRLDASRPPRRRHFGTAQRVDNLLQVGSGYQNPFPRQQQAPGLLMGMSMGPSQNIEPLPAHQYGNLDPFLPGPQVTMLAQQGSPDAGHSAEYLQNTAWGSQHTLLHQPQVPPPLPHTFFGMPQHASFFQIQDWGYQPPVGTGHNVDDLFVWPQQLNTAAPVPSPLPQQFNAVAQSPPPPAACNFRELEGLQMQSSSSAVSQLSNIWDSDGSTTSRTTSVESLEFGASDGLQTQPPAFTDDIAGAGIQFVDGNYEDFSFASLGMDQDWWAEMDKELAGMDLTQYSA